MVMYGVLVKAYAIMIFATGLDEMWNMNNLPFSTLETAKEEAAVGKGTVGVASASS